MVAMLPIRPSGGPRCQASERSSWATRVRSSGRWAQTGETAKSMSMSALRPSRRPIIGERFMKPPLWREFDLLISYLRRAADKFAHRELRVFLAASDVGREHEATRDCAWNERDEM